MQDRQTTEQTFDRFPVRIGRNALNDLQLDFPAVSQFHAILELHGDQIFVRDLGSKNGTIQQGGARLPPNTPVDLGVTSYEFIIPPFYLRVTPFTFVEQPAASVKLRAGALLAGYDEEPSTDRGGASAQARAAEVAARLKPDYENYRFAWSRLFREIQTVVAGMDVAEHADFCAELNLALPGLAHEADFKALEPIPIHEDSQTGSRPLTREAAVALQGVKELATWYLGRPTENAESVVNFLRHVQDSLDVFMKCFVPLRDGYQQFELQMDIQRGERPAMNGVQTAKDPRELARGLLDWKDGFPDAYRTIESTFADLMIHQVALLNGVMKGVKSLLGELSPQAFEKTLDDPARASSGLQIGPFRYKQLWELFAQRHADLAEEEKHAFALIFGPQFAQAYSQLANEVGQSPTVHTVSADFPSYRPPPPR